MVGDRNVFKWLEINFKMLGNKKNSANLNSGVFTLSLLLSSADVCSEDGTKLFDHCERQVMDFRPRPDDDDMHSVKTSARWSTGKFSGIGPNS